MGEKGGILKVSLKSLEADECFVKLHKGARSKTYARLTITDRGTGMAKETLEHLFEPFFARKPKEEGTGKGSTFQVYLPNVELETIEKEEKRDSLPTGEERVLFIDDEESIARLGEKMLTQTGYKVQLMTDPRKTSEIFNQSPRDFDPVATDQTMPGITGYHLTLKLMKVRKDIPVILCSGYIRIVDDARAREEGIKACFVKPVDKKNIAKRIPRVLD